MSWLEQARDLLPWWVPWLGPAAFVLIAPLASALACQVGTAIALTGTKRLGDVHWSERARANFPARSVGGLSLLMFPLVSAALAYFWVGPFSHVSFELLAVVAWCLSAAVVARRHLTVIRRSLPHPPTLGYWLRGAAVLWLVIRPALLIVAVGALSAPSELESPWMVLWTLAMVVFLGAAARGLSLPIAQALGLARPASARLRGLVNQATERVGIGSKAVFELTWPMANAAAFPASGVLVFSDAALRQLPDDEIVAVAAHELSHLSEPRRVLALRLLLTALWIPVAAVAPIAQAFGPEGYGVVLVAALVAAVVVRRTMRRMEQRADETATEHQSNPEAYARALESLYQHNAIPAVLARGTVHPHLYDRLVAAGVEPDWPRPKPPSRLRMHGAALVALLVALVVHVGAMATPPLLHDDDLLAEWPDLVELGTEHGINLDLHNLAWIREETGRPDEAIVLFRAAIEISHDPSYDYIHFVGLLARAGRCHEANAAMDMLVRWGAKPQSLEYAAASLVECATPSQLPMRP